MSIQVKTVDTCNCENITPGSYGRQIWLHPPFHMQKDNGFCIDLCIAQEISQLWMMGITTTGCCCGHNKVLGYIGVIEKDIDMMISMGYEVQQHPNGDTGYFTPKYNKLI